MATAPDTLFDLSGKVALITGSTRGIGKATALMMAQAGARIVVTSRKEKACADVAREIDQAGGEALPIPCDVADKDQLMAMVDGVLKHWRRIDVLVCNAAVSPHHGPLHEISEDAIDRLLTTNVKNQLLLCNKVIPGMAARKDGAVIIISSIAALKGTRRIGGYAITKAADIQMVRSLALEWADKGVRVNGIAPGLVRTDLARALWEDPARLKNALQAYPIGRIGEAEDIAAAALFLASKAAAFITGQTLIVDGGSTIANIYS
ncbi:MAG TPA: SDR family oxidoreductase [Rhodospirillales bacterium]|jgi:NAD(P)-dependent dehydrogenase (short-subunit alcohol dehydrogenase family)